MKKRKSVAKEFIEKMTTGEKFAQMTQTPVDMVFADGRKGLSPSLEDEMNGLGSALAYRSDFGAKKAQEENLVKNGNRIPLVFMMDVIHGWKTAFPIPLALGASFDPALAEKCCLMSAEEAVKDGVHVTFSPMVDLIRDARWGRVMESTSEDAYMNGEFGKAMIRGYHKGGLACCVKHFAAYGAAESGRDYNLADMSEYTLREYYLRAYKECLKEKPELVMTSFNTLNGIPAMANKHLMLDILRGEWKYDGVVISDYSAVREMIAHKFKPNGKEAAKAALNAAVDIDMCSMLYAEYGTELVESGEISVEKIDESVGRILKLKEKLGLFEDPYKKMTEDRAEITEKSRKIALQAARESVVLLKNDGTLPLAKRKKVAFIGPFVDTKEIIGSWSCFCDAEGTVTVKEGLENVLGKEINVYPACGKLFSDTDESLFDETVEAAGKADVIVAFIGEYQKESGECKSKTDIRIPSVQRKLIERISALGKKLVGVVFAGRPLEFSEIAKRFDALLYVWQPGTEGGNAIAEILYGKTNPSGKLPVSLPRSVGQCPLYYDCFTTGRPAPVDAGIVVGTSSYIDCLNSPLFPFGFGLSYTKFSLSDPVLSREKMRKGEKITVKFAIKNVGKRKGAEVVQMYLRDDFSEVVRPVKQLKGFKKVFLKSGEEREMSFDIDETTLGYYREDDELVVEKGTFTVFIGTSCESVKSCSFELI